MQVFLEEAHVLLERDKFKLADTQRDPYVRLAKEAAKFRIGMVYATQEIKSVEERILDNTANWVVAHLNSHKEIKELSHRYDFERFGDQILYAEDRGFVRLKTLSSPYVIPIQVRLFDAEMIREARAVALSMAGGQAELDI
jgi:DNA helicase HerA-like ATPase